MLCFTIIHMLFYNFPSYYKDNSQMLKYKTPSQKQILQRAPLRKIESLIKNIPKQVDSLKQKQVQQKKSIQKFQTSLSRKYQKPKIVKISDLINKNVCAKKQIDLKDLQISQNRVQKRKLEVSLSKQRSSKSRSISEKSLSKSTKIKLSLNRTDSMRKIKCFELQKQEKENIKHIKTPRLIQNLTDCQKNEVNSNRLIRIDNYSGHEDMQRRIIKIHRNK